MPGAPSAPFAPTPAPAAVGGAATRPRVWLVDLDELARAGDCERVLSERELHRADRFAVARLRRHFVARSAALRLVLGAALDVDPRAVPLATGALGKPRLAGLSELSFNLSHCEGAAAIALTTAGAIGVDVECAGRVDEQHLIASRFFDASEAETIAGLPRGLAESAFLRCWTAKEAVLKASGVGLTQPLRDVVVDADPRRPLRLRRVPAPLQPRDWTVHARGLPGRLVLATAVTAPRVPPPTVRRLDAAVALRSCAVRSSRRRRPSPPDR